MGPENTILLLSHWNYQKQLERNNNKSVNGKLKPIIKSTQSEKKLTVRFQYKYFGVNM